MPRRRKPERIAVWRDQRGRFVPPGALGVGARPITIRGKRGVPVRRDARTGQFVGKKVSVPVSRHPRTGRFITEAEADAIQKRPSVDLVHGFINQSPKLRLFYGGLTSNQQDWFDGRMLHWQRAGFEPRMAAKISVEEFERGEEFETADQVPEE